jgi:hypothetical protein
MNRAGPRSRVPLGQRNVNSVENQTAGLKAEASSSSASSVVVKATIIPLSRKDSKPIIQSSFNRQASTATLTTVSSEASSNCGGNRGGGGSSEGNKAFDSLSSETLRRVINSSAAAAAGGGGGGNDDEAAAAAAAAATRKQPLAASRAIGGQNQQRHPDVAVPSSVAAKKDGATSSSSTPNNGGSAGEPITIIEHRKRPCGDGHTVHTYLRGKLLGKGGFAKVYKVTSLDTNKEYAVKIVPKANLVKSRARQKVSQSLSVFSFAVHPSCGIRLDSRSRRLQQCSPIRFIQCIYSSHQSLFVLHFRLGECAAANGNKDTPNDEACQHLRVQTLLRGQGQLLHPP